jgi:hypothetical protein
MSGLIEIGGVVIAVDVDGRYCLNDLHKAAGGERRHGPSLWLENQQAKELVAELADTGIPVSVIKGGSLQGTYVCKELVYAYAMWISAKFHLKVIRTFDAAVRPPAAPSFDPGLSTLHRAQALDMATNVADRICARFPSLGEPAQQVIFAKIVNPIAGDEVIPLPRLESKTFSASEVGKLLNISGNKVGRLANEHGLKTSEFGVFVLDKSRSSEKQVSSFLYNQAGVDRLRQIVQPSANGDLLGGAK